MTDFLGVNFSRIGGSHFLQNKFIGTLRANKFRYLVTPNVDHVIRYKNDPLFRGLYSKASWIVCDSRILLLMAKIARVDIGELITGSDLTPKLLETSNRNSLKVAVVGCKDISAISNTYNNAAFRHYNPPMGFVNDPIQFEKCLAFIHAERFDFLFLCLGSPQQEKLANEVRKQGISTGVGFCVGAAFDFLTGEAKRAPILVQKFGFEWAFRMLSEPKRLAARYFSNLVIFKYFLKYILSKK
jgi:N-acetylglucosaminyldiphosphoundecaprenol N-acetyl-beta-D-mannosaminyltransferase